MTEIIDKDESYAIIGACMEVYNQMGFGFLEAVYQECLEMEFADRRIPFKPQQQLDLRYKHRPLKAAYIPDFLCYDRIIVEIKGIRELTDVHRSQVLNYLKGTGLKLGLLVNFGHPTKLQYERFVF